MTPIILILILILINLFYFRTKENFQNGFLFFDKRNLKMKNNLEINGFNDKYHFFEIRNKFGLFYPYLTSREDLQISEETKKMNLKLVEEKRLLLLEILAKKINK